ncbi:MAG: DUF167 domain-containing protein [Burkholderiaceae bacterium]|nr:MAG: DUF167 domain-containing protein [Burkholderiaceae bacterium]
MASLTLCVRVKPGSRISELTQDADGTWLARLKAPPVDGKANAELVALVARRFGVPKANAELVALVARRFGVPKANVTIAAGLAGRIKRVRVER